MREPHAAAAVVLLLWLAVLTVAFHGCGGRLGCGSAGSVVVRETAYTVAAVPRKMLLAMTSFDAASPSATDHHHHHHRQHQHHQHQHDHHHPHRHHLHHHHVDRWNQQGIPPSAAAGNGEEEIDPRYGVQKRLVPSGPNPLHH